MRLGPQNVACRCLVSEQVAGAGATVPQSCEQWETEHLKVYQEGWKHSKYVEVRTVAKNESRGQGAPGGQAGQAAHLGCRMTDGRFKTGHYWSPETRQVFIHWELSSRSESHITGPG